MTVTTGKTLNSFAVAAREKDKVPLPEPGATPVSRASCLRLGELGRQPSVWRQ